MDSANKPNQVAIPKVELSLDRHANGAAGTDTPLPDLPFLRDNVACDTRKRARTRKSMSRRSGQNGYIEKSGNWYVVRWRMDVEGQDERRYLRERICPISGPDKLSAITYLKTNAAYRDVDLHPDVAEFLQRYRSIVRYPK